MKIEGPIGVPGSPVRLRRPGATRAQDTFATHLDGEAAAAGAGPTAPLAPMQALVALQEVPEPLRGRRADVQYGHDVLDALEALRLALVLGRVPGARLAALSTMVREKRARCDDPRLADLLAEIELRAEVELAKLGRLA